MQPNLFKFEDAGQQTSLYASDLSTRDALRMFAPTDSIAITKFGASNPKTAARNWISQKDLPLLATVGDVIRFLDQNDQICLIDFSATIDNGARLSTHDDGEAHFLFSEKAHAVDRLYALLGKDALPEHGKAVLSNPGKYVLLKKGDVKIFTTFKDFLAEKSV